MSLPKFHVSINCRVNKYFLKVVTEHINHLIVKHADRFCSNPRAQASETSVYMSGNYILEFAVPIDREDLSAKIEKNETGLSLINTGGSKFTGICKVNAQNLTSELRNVQLVQLPPHSDRPEAFKAADDRAHEHYANVLRASDEQKAIKEALAGYWYTIQATFSMRGSAAISEYALRSILLARGIVLPLVVKGTSIDLLANLYAKEDFIGRADEWFQSPVFATKAD